MSRLSHRTHPFPIAYSSLKSDLSMTNLFLLILCELFRGLALRSDAPPWRRNSRVISSKLLREFMLVGPFVIL